MTKLKKCPFCGSAASHGTKVMSYCSNQDCRIHGVFMQNKVWNTRPIEKAQAAEIKQLKAEIGRLKLGRLSNEIGKLKIKIVPKVEVKNEETLDRG
jgi:hypothetical protein